MNKNEKNLKGHLPFLSIDGKMRKIEDFTEDIKTSVDFFFEDTGTKYYIEVDSYNMAKCVFGQYLLLNQTEVKKEKCVFVVIHFYNGYNPERTKVHLKFAQNKYGCTIPASTFHFDTLKNIKNSVEFIKLINDNIIK
jgi:hypothetical protein